jgi:hypothetical protein
MVDYAAGVQTANVFLLPLLLLCKAYWWAAGRDTVITIVVQDQHSGPAVDPGEPGLASQSDQDHRPEPIHPKPRLFCRALR